MNNDFDNPESSSGRFIHSVQPHRDLDVNWTIDLAKNLEEYLLKICTGDITGSDENLSVNFAEAALLLQGSVQVYSRKVEYLYSLVLHAFDFISHQSQEDENASTSDQPESSNNRKAKVREDIPFMVSDDIPVEPKNLLDDINSGDTLPCHFSRPPANLVVLEGECLDAGGDAGELESYLLATNDLYRDFILLDSCESAVVDEFLDCETSKGPSRFGRGSSIASKSRKSFLSPSRRSGPTPNKVPSGKKMDENVTQSPCVNHGIEANCHMGSPNTYDFPEGGSGLPEEEEFSTPRDSDNSDDEEDDPWKPLNPHEPGNLRVKPYKRVKSTKSFEVGRKPIRPLTSEFPLAKLEGPISKELREMWEAKSGATARYDNSQPLPVYEKLRQSLFAREVQTNDAFPSGADNTEDNGYDSGDSDTGPADMHIPDDHLNDNDVPPYQEQHNDINDTFEDRDADASLEDLCKSHLDSLLATFAETEKQTELATRVSTWKQRIEKNLDVQDARPPFDIHKYGERVMEKLSSEGSDGTPLSFGDVVKGQQKHDVARTFSALLQLVNNGDVELMKNSVNGTSICYTDVKPFQVRLLKNERRKGILLQSSRKRPKTPIMKKNPKKMKGKENSPAIDSSSPPGSTSSSRFSLRKSSGGKSSSKGKKRQKSRVDPLDLLHLAG